MSCSFLHAQDTLEELITFELPTYACNNICYNKNQTGTDLNNDGYDDFIYNFWNTELNQNEFHFHFGSSSPSTEPDYVFIKEPCAGSPTWGGDINGDGYNDIVYYINESEFDPGVINICWGSEELDFETDVFLDGFNYGATGFKGFNGGYDFNGDGFDDILAEWNYPFALYYCYHIFLGAENFDQVTDVLIEFDDTIQSSSAVGDMNGDGYDDLILSHNTNDGQVFELYLGGNEMDNVVDYTFPKVYENGSNHRTICNGDFNGDNLDDLAIHDNSVIDIFFGSSELNFILDTLIVENRGLGSPIYCDINNDGYNDFITFGNTFSPLEVEVFLFYGSTEIPIQPDIILFVHDNYFGVRQVSSNLGDFNGDGNNDIFIHQGNTGEPNATATIYTMEISQISENDINLKKIFLSNYPNPFNPVTTISYELPVNVTNPVIDIFNIKGEKIRTFNCQNQMPIIWDGSNNYQNQVSSGVYLYQIKSDEGVLISEKMLLLK